MNARSDSFSCETIRSCTFLTLFNRNGKIAACDDDWSANTSSDAVALAAAMKHAGAVYLPATSKDLALLLELPAGAFLMHATGSTGIVHSE